MFRASANYVPKKCANKSYPKSRRNRWEEQKRPSWEGCYVKSIVRSAKQTHMLYTQKQAHAPAMQRTLQNQVPKSRQEEKKKAYQEGHHAL